MATKNLVTTIMFRIPAQPVKFKAYKPLKKILESNRTKLQIIYLS